MLIKILNNKNPTLDQFHILMDLLQKDNELKLNSSYLLVVLKYISCMPMYITFKKASRLPLCLLLSLLNSEGSDATRNLYLKVTLEK